MDDESLVEQLDLVAERLGVEVRFEAFEGPGGLCVLRGQDVLFVNSDMSSAEQVEVMGAALSKLELDSVYVVPEVRAFLERYRSR